jgi:hypothetical protein
VSKEGVGRDGRGSMKVILYGKCGKSINLCILLPQARIHSPPSSPLDFPSSPTLGDLPSN